MVGYGWIKWNFIKFLIGCDGCVFECYVLMIWLVIFEVVICDVLVDCLED